MELKKLFEQRYGSDFKKLKETTQKHLEKTHVKTNNFGWVKKELYEKYGFLRKDKGVPVEQLEESEKQKSTPEVPAKILSKITNEYKGYLADIGQLDKQEYAKQKDLENLQKELSNLGI